MAIAHNSNLARILKDFYRYMKLKYDVFIVITGGEGLGKSRSMFLPIIDYWYTEILKKPIPEGRYGVKMENFIRSLKSGQTYDICGLDEAGDAMDKENYRNMLNRILYESYTIIREKLFFTIIVLPSFFDLNPRFRKRRVRGIFEIYRRVNNFCKDCEESFTDSKKCPECGSKNFKKGYVLWRYYSRARINKILLLNKNREVKKLSVVSPSIEGRAYMYQGKLLKAYQIEKQEKMDEAINSINEIIEATEENAFWQCPKCKSKDSRRNKKDQMFHCRRCLYAWNPDIMEKDAQSSTKTKEKDGFSKELGVGEGA